MNCQSCGIDASVPTPKLSQRITLFGTSAFLTIFLLSVGAFGQHRPLSLGPKFCTDFPSAKAACESFKELVERRDKELLAILSQRCRMNSFGSGRGARQGSAYACFIEGEDRFLTVGFSMPASKEEVPSGVVTGDKGLLCLDEYKQGMPGDTQRSTELENDPLAPAEDKPAAMSPVTGKELGLSDVRAAVDSSAIWVSYSFLNGNGGKTDYQLKIRRSTKRFVETYEGDKKTYTETGHCAVF
jgi:hypothetical protein